MNLTEKIQRVIDGDTAFAETMSVSEKEAAVLALLTASAHRGAGEWIRRAPTRWRDHAAAQLRAGRSPTAVMPRELREALAPLVADLARDCVAPGADHAEIFERAIATGSAVAECLFSRPTLNRS